MAKEAITQIYSKRNFRLFIWHGLFLALASNLMDVNTVIPSMLIKVGASSVHLGFLTAIMIGGASFMQLIFSAMLSSQAYKKKWLLLGINVRVLMLLLLGLLIFYYDQLSKGTIFLSIYFLISIFAFSGSFANVSYIDIIGKGIDSAKRKQFFSLKQTINSVGVLLSALLAAQILKALPYPENYSRMFFLAGILLLIASLGFWLIAEKSPSGKKTGSLSAFFRDMPKEIKANVNLKHYLIIINTLGIGVSLIPFIIMMAKQSFGLSFDKIGNFILFQTLGMISGSLAMYLGSGKISYKYSLIAALLLAVSIPPLALILQHRQNIFDYIFILTGLYSAVYKISVNAILIEISNNSNRTLYAGISGAGNLLPMVLPIFIGVLIKTTGFNIVFIFAAIFILLSIYSIGRLNCVKAEDKSKSSIDSTHRKDQ